MLEKYIEKYIRTKKYFRVSKKIQKCFFQNFIISGFIILKQTNHFIFSIFKSINFATSDQ